MKQLVILTLGAIVACAAGVSWAADAPAAGKKVLRHVVLFKFKDESKPEEIAKVIQAFEALPKKIDVIRDFEWGTDVGAENLAQGFTHCFLVTYADTKGRDAYLPHPAHEEFKTLVKPHLDKVLVVDYWTAR